MEGIRFTGPRVDPDGTTVEAPVPVSQDNPLPVTGDLTISGDAISVTVDTGELATEAAVTSVQGEVQGLRADLATPATSIPHFALVATSDLTHAFVTSSASGEQDMVAATSGQTTRLHRFTITAAAATVVELRDGPSGAALKTIEFPAAGAYVFDFDPRPYAKTTANTKLVRNSTVATKVTIDFEYVKSA